MFILWCERIEKNQNSRPLKEPKKCYSREAKRGKSSKEEPVIINEKTIGFIH